MSQSTQCLECVHTTFSMRYCDAFPEGIPDVIMTGMFDHRQPFEGDHGIRYEPDPALEHKDEGAQR